MLPLLLCFIRFEVDDQYIANVILRSKLEQNTSYFSTNCSAMPQGVFPVCFLDLCTFSSGVLDSHYSVWSKHVEANHLEVYTVHANFISGNVDKMRSMTEKGLWITHWPLDQCESYEGKVFPGTSYPITNVP